MIEKMKDRLEQLLASIHITTELLTTITYARVGPPTIQMPMPTPPRLQYVQHATVDHTNENNNGASFYSIDKHEGNPF